MPGALAAQAPPFAQLLQQARESAPDLLAGAAEVTAAQGQARQAAAWPNPRLQYGKENFSGNAAWHDSFERTQDTWSISMPLELGGQRQARAAAAQAQLGSAEARNRQQLADFGYRLALAYAAAEVAQQRAQLRDEELARAREDLRSARALVAAGREADLHAMQAEAAAAAAEADLAAAQAERVAALGALAALAGADEAYDGVQPQLLEHAAASPVTVGDLPDGAPAVRTAQAEVEAAQRRVTVERRAVLPTPDVSVGTRRWSGDNSAAWVAGVSVPLPLFDHNRGALAAARAQLRVAEARLTAADVATRSDWQAARARAVAADRGVTAADAAAGAAREAYRLARIGYDAGRTALPELLQTRRTLAEAGLRSLDARFARVLALAELARLRGQMPFEG